MIDYYRLLRNCPVTLSYDNITRSLDKWKDCMTKENLIENKTHIMTFKFKTDSCWFQPTVLVKICLWQSIHCKCVYARGLSVMDMFLHCSFEKTTCCTGSTIYTDGWRSYVTLNDKGYEHYTVEHKHAFKCVYHNVDSGEVIEITTNRIEGAWKHAKVRLKFVMM